jgi:hypothetical protein
MSDVEILAKLLELNLQRSGSMVNFTRVWESLIRLQHAVNDGRCRLRGHDLPFRLSDG